MSEANLPFVTVRPRLHHKRKQVESAAPSPPPPPGNQIVSVSHGGEGDLIVVVTNSAVSAVTDLATGLWVMVDGDGYAPIVMHPGDPTHLTFQFPIDVSTATAWHVEDPSVWEFADSEPLEWPFDGEIS